VKRNPAFRLAPDLPAEFADWQATVNAKEEEYASKDDTVVRDSLTVALFGDYCFRLESDRARLLSWTTVRADCRLGLARCVAV
jgi:hypothetical protein